MSLRIVIKNLNPHGSLDGPHQVKLAADARIAQLGHQAVVGFRVGKSRAGWYAQPLCGPLAPALPEMNAGMKVFEKQSEAIDHADAEIRRWCAEMASMIGQVQRGRYRCEAAA